MPHQQYRKYQLFKIPANWHCIASNEQWTLWCNPNKSQGAWCSLYLRRMVPGPKYSYWFGWNGTRFADNRDFRTLQEHNPTVVAWLQRTIDGPWWHNVRIPRLPNLRLVVAN